MKRTSIIFGVFTMAVLTACVKDVKQVNGLVVDETPSATRSDNPVAQAASDPYVANEVLVKFKKGVSENGRANALARINGSVQEKVLTNAMKSIGDEGFYVVHTPLGVLQAIDKMKGVENVEIVEPNFIYTHETYTAPVDKYYANGELWGMKTGFGSNAESAWAAGATGSTSVYVGIIDEGIQFDHSELAGQVWTNTADNDNDGIDDDGSGYPDDVHGWDFDGNDNTIYDGGPRGSLDDHGTHVSGTIAAKNNASGVVGINWNVTLISAKFLGRRGGTTANAVKAVDYFTTLKTLKGLNIVATNNSWGGGGYSSLLFSAISRANTAGILFIAAAGNGGSDGNGDNNDVTSSYPSNYNLDNVISVAAIDNSGALASFSNYGSTTVDLGAPGVGIISSTAYNTLSNYSGTSMATPHVTGAVALYAAYKGLNPTNAAGAAAIKAAILNSAANTPSLVGKTFTGGRLDVFSALSK